MQVRRILIVKLGSIGDVIHSLPVVAALRATYPQAQITWIVEEKASDLLRGHPDLHDLIVIDSRRWRRQWGVATFRSIWRTWRRLRAGRYDLAIDLQGLVKSGVVTYLSGATIRLGFAVRECREPLSALFTNCRLAVDPCHRHVVEKNLGLLRALGVEERALQRPRFPLYSEPSEVSYIEAFLAKAGVDPGEPLVAIHPGAGRMVKRWGAEKFAHLADRILQGQRLRLLVTWGPGEEAMVQEMVQLMTHKALVACPTTLRQSMPLLRRCRLVIGSDTGPLHLAAALGVPTLGIYGGSSDPARNGPYGNLQVVLSNPQPCSWCYRDRCRHPQVVCMEGIGVDEVYFAFLKLWQGEGLQEGRFGSGNPCC